MKKLIILTLIFSLFILWSVSLVSAVCTVTLDKESYNTGETATATMVCDNNNEKNDPYTLNWTYQNGTVVESDTGTTPNTVSQAFFESYTIPTSWPAGIFINATLIGTDLEGTDSANVTASSTSSLLITDVTFSDKPILLGKKFGLSFKVKDENDKLISNAQCSIDLSDGGGFPIETSQNIISYAGVGAYSEIISKDNFDENRQYVANIKCFCGSNSTDSSCIDEDGTPVYDSVGSAQGILDVDLWFNVNVVTDRSVYLPKDEIFICSNITAVNTTERTDMEIFHQARCSADSDNDGDLDRAIILSDDDEPDKRGIGVGQTQMQCKRFRIPEPRYLQGKNSECYASTTIWILNERREILASYDSTSAVFNISSTELQIDPDWAEVEDHTFNTIINLSAEPFVTQYNSSLTNGNLDIRLSKPVPETLKHEDQYDIKPLFFDDFVDALNIQNITVRNQTNTLVKGTDYFLEFLNDGYLEIEIRNTDLTQNAWYNVTLQFHNYDLRQTDALEGLNSSNDRQATALENHSTILTNHSVSLDRQATALEGIENKTGTFHLDIECPSTWNSESDMDCIITYYIEQDQLVQKETDFTCYINTDDGRYSSVNFNQMVTRAPGSTTKSFYVHENLTIGLEYTLQCEASYYNLGSRTDLFFDTFVVRPPEKEAGSGLTVEKEEEEEVKKVEQIADTIEEKLGLSPGLFLLILFGIIALLILIPIFYKKSKEKKQVKNITEEDVLWH